MVVQFESVLIFELFSILVAKVNFFNIGFNIAILQSSGKFDSFIDKFIIFSKKELILLHHPSEMLLELHYSSVFTGTEVKQKFFNNLFEYVCQLKVIEGI